MVVPFLDNADHIERCIEALLAQDPPPGGYEVILVDNGSRDFSRAKAERYAGIRIIEEGRRGAYAARNRGVGAARGEILAFTDADCVPARDWLRQHVEALSEPGTQVVLGSRQPGRATSPLRLMTIYEDTKVASIFSGSDPSIFYGYTNNMAVRKKTLVGLGGFRTVLRGADSVFVRAVGEREGPGAVRYRREAVVTHLEVTTLWHWYRKEVIYGRSNQRNSRQTVTTRPHGRAGRLRTYQATVGQHGLGAGDAALLFLIICAGGLAYETGRLLGRLEPIDHPTYGGSPSGTVS